MINIVIKTGEKLPGIKNAFITFEEYNQQLIDKVRKLQDRRYNADTKTWEISLYDLEYFIAAAKEYTIKLTLQNELGDYIQIPKNYEFKTSPYEYQRVGVEYGLNHNNFILADEQGLGKSKQIVDLACVRKLNKEIKQCLIICCVNSIKYNWQKEVEIHSNESAFVLGTRFRKNGKRYNGSVQDRIDDLKTHNEFFLITNMETLRNEEFVKELNKKSKSIQMIALDESHFCRNPQATQSKGLLKLKDFKYKIAMSGTPIVNNPLDAYTSLKWLGLEKAPYSTFKNYYCEYGGFGNHQVTSYRNLSHLRDSLSSNMLRRLKSTVLDLPEKVEKTEYIEMSDNQWKIYEEMRDEVLENIDLIASSPNPLSMLLRLRQATGDTSILSSTIKESAKLDRLEEIVEELSQSDRKCLVFSNWTQMTSRIKERLRKYNPAYITGEIDNVTRQSEVEKFQTNNSCKVCIGSVGAMGTGLTLTAADTVIFVDLPWHRAAYDQCSDRVHRIGQKNNVTIIKMICVDTIDERIDSIIIRKGATADLLVDGKVTKLSRNDILQLIA